jgi:hypothetical protein
VAAKRVAATFVAAPENSCRDKKWPCAQLTKSAFPLLGEMLLRDKLPPHLFILAFTSSLELYDEIGVLSN